MKNMKKLLCLLMAVITLVSALALCVAANEPVDAEIPTEESSENTPTQTPKMIFEPMNFIKNLNYMGVGMLGIFIVIGVIVLCTMGLNRAFQDRD